MGKKPSISGENRTYTFPATRRGVDRLRLTVRQAMDERNLDNSYLIRQLHSCIKASVRKKDKHGLVKKITDYNLRLKAVMVALELRGEFGAPPEDPKEMADRKRALAALDKIDLGDGTEVLPPDESAPPKEELDS